MEPEEPCPAHVGEGRDVRYCEEGPKGHPGTCIGDRTRGEYRAKLHAWKEFQKQQKERKV